MQFITSNFTLPCDPNPELEALLRKRSRILQLPPQTVFCDIGDRLEGVFYIADGRTSHYIVGEEGSEKMLYTLTRGWFFGETATTLEKTSSLISKTNTNATLYQIPRDEFEPLMRENAMFCHAVLECYARKTLIMRHEIENITFSSYKDRLRKLLYATADTSRLLDGMWYNQRVHYTHADLSVIIGGSRITTTKMLNELCDEGFIRVINRSTQINAKKMEQFRP